MTLYRVTPGGLDVLSSEVAVSGHGAPGGLLDVMFSGDDPATGKRRLDVLRMTPLEADLLRAALDAAGIPKRNQGEKK